MKAKLTFHAVVGTLLLALPTLQAATPGQSAQTNSSLGSAITNLFGDPVIAKGKGFEIKRSELDDLVTKYRAAAAAQNLSVPSGRAIEKGALDSLIDERLLLAEANDADRAKGAQKADLQMAALRKQAGSQEALNLLFKARGITAAAYKQEIARLVTANSALERELKIVVTDKEATNFYEEHHADFEQPETVRLRDILLLKVDPATHRPLPPDQQQAKLKQADNLLKRIHNGESFKKLVEKYSEDPNSNGNGGELPLLARDQMWPELAAAAFSLTNNQVSGVIDTSVGYYIIQLLGKNPAKVVPYSGMDTRIAGELPGQKPVTIRDVLTVQAVRAQAPAFLEKLREKAGVQILDPDLKAVEEGEGSVPDANVSGKPAAK